MTAPALAPTAAAPEIAVETSALAGALWLLGAGVLALLAMYFIGLDEGMSSVFGKTAYLHELVHDGRHLLGFPCH
jgi:hypothetical protein